MNKKIILFSSVALIVIFIVYLAKLNMVTNEHQDSLKDLKQKITNIEQENDKLKQKADIKDIVEETEVPLDTNLNVIITDVSIRSNDMYKEGDLKDRIYGGFSVAVKVKNLSKDTYDNLKVASIFVTSLPNYEKNIKSESKAKTILDLKSEEETEIVFEGFHVDHPETIQEMIVSVMDDRNDVSDIKKIKIKAVFSPDSND